MPTDFDVGWTLREAIRRAVDPDLLKRCVSAEREWRRVGAPTRSVRHVGLTNDLCATGTNRGHREMHAFRSAQPSAADAVGEALRGHLVSGQLVARGRRGSPLAESVSIPASAWKTLKFGNFTRSIAAEPPPAKTSIYDLRVVPALYADDVVARLDDKPLVQVFDRFVFNDPQVESLRKRAIARGGNPRNVGFQSRLYHAYWYIDHGTAPDDDSIGFLLDRDDLPLARLADEALRDRFRRIIQVLQDGALVAEGALNGQGATVEISRAMWMRPGAVLDLVKGDYFDRYPDSGNDPEDRVAPLYLSLILRRPKPALRDMLHVKPIGHVVLRPATTGLSPSPGGKGIRGAADRQRIEGECREWLENLMRESPDQRTATNDQLFATARKRWGISERSFSTARRLAIADAGAHAWGVAGATPKSLRGNRRGD